MSPTRPKSLSELAGAENVPETLRDSLLEEESEELESRYGLSPEEFEELVESFQEHIDTSDTTYLLLGSYGDEGYQLETVRETLDEYPHTQAYLSVDLPNETQQPLLLSLKLAADLVDHILFIMDSEATESEWVALELGLLLEEHLSKTDILLHEDVADGSLAFNVYQALIVFQGKTQIYDWSSEEDLLRQINNVVMQHTNEGFDQG